MDIAEGKKDIYVKYLNYLRVGIYQRILDSNSELVHKLYKKKKNASLEGDPLWLFHGGELINLYSSDKNKVPTKDIDLKLYFTGDYSVDPKIFKRACQKIKPIHMKDYDFHDIPSCQKTLDANMRGFRGIMGAKTPSGNSCYDIWEMGETQRNNLCSSLLLNNLKGTYSQINLKTGKVRSGLELDDFAKCRPQKWTNGDRCKAFMVNVPYITQVGRDNVPYDINDKTLHKLGIDYDEEIDGYPIDEENLTQLDEKVRAWTEDETLKTTQDKRNYLMNKLKVIRVKDNKFKLSSVIGVTLVHNETRGQWYLFQEGVLDAYIDYGAGYHLDLEKEYLGRYQDGSFPTVLKKVAYGNRSGLMRVPTLTWLIYDQLRMLYVTVRGQYLGCDDKHCAWIKLGGGAQGNYAKYFKKLKGLLNSFEGVIEGLQDENLDDVGEALQKCKGLNMEVCGFQPFLTSLFENFQFDLMKGKRFSKLSKLGKSNKSNRSKRRPTRDRARKTHRRSSGSSVRMVDRLRRKDQDFEIYD